MCKKTGDFTFTGLLDAIQTQSDTGSDNIVTEQR